MDPVHTEELEFFKDNFSLVCCHMFLFRDCGSQNDFLLSQRSPASVTQDTFLYSHWRTNWCIYSGMQDAWKLNRYTL